MEATLSDERQTRLSDQAAAHVRSLILAGRLTAGTQLRAEDIGRELGISATPVREGLQTLRAEGLVEMHPRLGFVAGELTADDVRDLFTGQALLSGELAARAATRVDHDRLRELTAIHHELAAAAMRHDEELLERKNHEFHRLVNLLAGSRKLAWIEGILAHSVPRSYYASVPGWPDATISDHGAILDALRAGDVDGARETMRHHIAHAGALLATDIEHRVRDSIKNETPHMPPAPSDQV
jgi:DNA-binding GntR family transcriptional regulator